jgi:hypothetical protein
MHDTRILELIAGKVDMTLAEIAEHLEREHEELFAPLSRLPRSDLQPAHVSEQERPDVVAERQAWRAAQPEFDAKRPVLIAGTRASTKMARLRGRPSGSAG